MGKKLGQVISGQKLRETLRYIQDHYTRHRKKACIVYCWSSSLFTSLNSCFEKHKCAHLTSNVDYC